MPTPSEQAKIVKLYAYCVLNYIETLPESLTGIAASKVHLFKSGSLASLVSDFAEEVVPVTRDNALAHAAVVRSVLDQTTPLPFRFGTLVTEQQLRNYLEAYHEVLLGRLEQVNGCVEMSVKIISGGIPADEAKASGKPEGKPGTAFLLDKRKEVLGSEVRAEQAKKIAFWLEKYVGELVRETRIDTNASEKLLVAVAHLVERNSVQPYRAKLNEARRQRPELHFLVSGPWPPYSFADIDLEFKTQFGVS